MALKHGGPRREFKRKLSCIPPLRASIFLFVTPTQQPEQGTNAYVCSMEVENFDQTAEKIAGRGGIVALPKFAVPGVCWQGYFLDPEGTFGIFQPDPKAK